MSYQTLLDAIIKGDIKAATEETLKAVETGENAQDILDQGLIEAMNIVGEKFFQRCHICSPNAPLRQKP